MTVLHFNKFYADKRSVDEAVKQHAANNSYEPQRANNWDDGLEYQRLNIPLQQGIQKMPLNGVEYVSTRQMAWACAVLFVVIVAVSFLPWWL